MLQVHKVLTASIADRDGRIHRGDRILSMNGKSTKGSTHREALHLLKVCIIYIMYPELEN
jgi:C-terminal processing protease CtpA/Prc